MAQVPPIGYAVIDAAGRPNFVPPSIERTRLENDLLRIVFNGDGSIASCFDKEHGREVLAPGAAGNVLAIYRDEGDAWDIPMDYRDRAPERLVLEAVEIVEDGPRAALCHRYRFGDSVLRQEVVVFAGSRRVDFVTSVDWHENKRMLRTSFPVNVRAKRGDLRHPVRLDSPADALQHPGRSRQIRGLRPPMGRSVRSRIWRRLVERLQIRSPSARQHPRPQPVAQPRIPGPDRRPRAPSLHLFALSACGRSCRGRSGARRIRVEREAAAACCLCPAAGRCRRPRPGSQPEAANVVVETLKEAEDGHGLIVRLYEAAGATTRTTLHCGFALAAAEATDLIEENPVPIEIAGRDLPLDLRPFEIVTLRLQPDLSSRQQPGPTDPRPTW